MSSWDPEKETEQSFIGIPIMLDYKTLGVLIVNLPYNPRNNYQSNQEFLTLVASAMLQPIRVQHVIETEREKLINENVVLKQKLKEE